MRKIVNAFEVIVFIVCVLFGCSLDSLSIPNAVMGFLFIMIAVCVLIILEKGVSD